MCHVKTQCRLWMFSKLFLQRTKKWTHFYLEPLTSLEWNEPIFSFRNVDIYELLPNNIKNETTSSNACSFGDHITCIRYTMGNPNYNDADNCTPGCHQYETAVDMMHVSIL